MGLSWEKRQAGALGNKGSGCGGWTQTEMEAEIELGALGLVSEAGGMERHC